MSDTRAASDDHVPGAPPWAQDRRSIGDIIRSILDHTRSLLRDEVQLAKIELTEALGAKAKGAGLLAAAGVMGLFALGFLAAAGASALDLVLPTWAAQLIVAAIFLLVTVVAALLGRGAIRAGATKPERTVETLKEDAQWAKSQIER